MAIIIENQGEKASKIRAVELRSYFTGSYKKQRVVRCVQEDGGRCAKLITLVVCSWKDPQVCRRTYPRTTTLRISIHRTYSEYYLPYIYEYYRSHISPRVLPIVHIPSITHRTYTSFTDRTYPREYYQSYISPRILPTVQIRVSPIVHIPEYYLSSYIF